MFNLREYILKLLDGSIGNEADYKVRELALGWYEKGVLVQADLEAVDSLIEAQYSNEEETTEEISIEYDSESENSAEPTEETKNEENV